MRQGRVLLVGDAAHVTNPTGGLGLTSGLFDLYALLDPLAAVTRGDAGTEALDLWSEQRLAKFNEMASPMAVQFKTVVYDERDLEKRRAVIAMGNEAKDPSVQRERLGFFKALETGLPEAVR